MPPLAITKANEEISKIRKQQQDAYVSQCDTPCHLINIEDIGDNDLEPSSESLNLLKGEMR